MRQSGVSQGADVLHTIRFGAREGLVCTPLVSGNTRIGDAEVADMQLIQHDVFGLSQRWFSKRIPSRWLKAVIGKVDELRARTVHRKAELSMDR